MPGLSLALSKNDSLGAQIIAGSEVSYRGSLAPSGGSEMFISGADLDAVYSYECSTIYDISTASHNNTLNPAETGDIGAVTFNGDGSKLYVVDSSSVLSYDLSTVYDITTASHNNTLDVSSEDLGPEGMGWNNDGTKLYVQGLVSTSIYEYDCSTPYDISTAVLNQSLDVGTEESNPLGMAWDGDGSKVYVVGSDGVNAVSYSCSVSFDISTASHTNTMDISGQNSWPSGVGWNSDGSKLYIVGEDPAGIFSYDCSTLYDISTSTLNNTLDVSSEDTAPDGIAWVR